ncbi:N-acetylmuramidase family protein [Chryseobacterium sp. PTM-20240506]|uniref:N-acetylmuramidase family protein n=1 Tax=Chryseobacterium sp. PTM-20240506 TaxID=3400631 RepID=UPI003AAD0EB3
MKTITEQDLRNSANKLRTDIATVKTVNEVESSGSGFLPDGQPKILFEGHVFWRELKKRGINPFEHLKGNEDILYEKWTKKYYKGGAAEHLRLQKASKINRDAALASASWGSFQIMGFNYKLAGYSSLQTFINAMYESAGKQLDAFVNFVINNKLDDELRNKDWDAFAKGYNGSGYKANKYDEKLASAYKKYSKN